MNVWQEIQRDLPALVPLGPHHKIKKVQRFLNAAAVLIVAAAIAVPIAMANNEWFRSVIYQLVLQDGAGGITASLEADPADSFFVPAEWKGLYYPASISDSFHVSAVNGDSSLELTDNAQRLLILEEHLPQDAAWIDTAEKKIEKIMIGHMDAYIIEGEGNCTIILPLEERLMIISSSSLSRGELTGISASVRRIIRESSH